MSNILKAKKVNGMLMVCKSADQQTKAYKVRNLSGKSVEGFIPGASSVKEIIYKVSSEL